MDETNFVIDENQPRPPMGPGYENQMMVNETTRWNMSSMGKWMKFLGIIGIISGILMIVFACLVMFAGFSIEEINVAGGGVVLGIVYIISGIVVLFLSSKLFSAGKCFKNAANYNDSMQLDKAVSNQNTYFGCTGILAIVYIVFLVIGLIGVIVASVSS